MMNSVSEPANNCGNFSTSCYILSCGSISQTLLSCLIHFLVCLISSERWANNDDVVKMFIVLFLSSVKQDTFCNNCRASKYGCVKNPRYSLSFLFDQYIDIILDTFFLTCTQSTTTLVTDIHCINHTARSLHVHYNII